MDFRKYVRETRGAREAVATAERCSHNKSSEKKIKRKHWHAALYFRTISSYSCTQDSATQMVPEINIPILLLLFFLNPLN